jgi:hypothetical protein
VTVVGQPDQARREPQRLAQAYCLREHRKTEAETQAYKENHQTVQPGNVMRGRRGADIRACHSESQ